MTRFLVVMLYTDEDGDEAGLFVSLAGHGTPLEAVRHVVMVGDAPKGWHFAQAYAWPEEAANEREAAEAWKATSGWA